MKILRSTVSLNELLIIDWKSDDQLNQFYNIRMK